MEVQGRSCQLNWYDVDQVAQGPITEHYDKVADEIENDLAPRAGAETFYNLRETLQSNAPDALVDAFKQSGAEGGPFQYALGYLAFAESSEYKEVPFAASIALMLLASLPEELRRSIGPGLLGALQEGRSDITAAASGSDEKWLETSVGAIGVTGRPGCVDFNFSDAQALSPLSSYLVKTRKAGAVSENLLAALETGEAPLEAGRCR